MSNPLLKVSNLSVTFNQGEPISPAVDNISFQISQGETFALVGESGSGKSVTALSVLRLLPPAGKLISGEVIFEGLDLLKLSENALCKIRGAKIGMIFQDPMSALNPVMTIGQQIGEVLRLHTKLSGIPLKNRVLELLELVGLSKPSQHFTEYPHQLSGGMRQRAMIAIALAGEPELLIADEPTTALDVTLQAQILMLLKELQLQKGMALWLITHDLGIVAQYADRVCVLRQGVIVEENITKTFFKNPQHPYSRQLFDAKPKLENCRFHSNQMKESEELLKIIDYKVQYPIRSGLLQREVGRIKAVDGVSFSIKKGQTLALVGESGCGKTTLGKALLNVIKPTSGIVYYEGELTDMKSKRSQFALRGKLQIIFQDPYSSMDPRMLVGEIIEEGIRNLLPEITPEHRVQRVNNLLQSVGLNIEARLRYPHEFSGGQRQRICIARALATSPQLIVCDEPTSALDVSVQQQIIGLLKEVQKKQNLSYLFISHDLAVVAELADQVAVMQMGKIVEIGETAEILTNPKQEYTKKLLQAIPKIHFN